MWNRRGGVVRYNLHVYTYSDLFGVGAATFKLREMASAVAVVCNWSVGISLLNNNTNGNCKKSCPSLNEESLEETDHIS